MDREKLKETLKEILQEIAESWRIRIDSLDELTEKLLDPEGEGYSWTWAEIFQIAINKVYGEDIKVWPLAESWDFLLTTDDERVLGVLSHADTIAPAPYLGFDDLVKSVEEMFKLGEERGYLPAKLTKDREKDKEVESPEEDDSLTP